MAWPSNNKASTQYTDQDSDRIADARPEINKTIENQNSMIDHLDIANAQDGDIMRYNGTTGKWETQSGASIQQQSLYVPMGAFGINTWYRDSYSLADKQKFFNKCLLGGEYMNRGQNNNVVSEQPVYGAIEGAQVVRAAATQNTPADRVIEDAVNVGPIYLTSGVISYAASHTDTSTNFQYNYHKYSTFTDNYIGLPAGTYRISFLNEGPDGEIESGMGARGNFTTTTGRELTAPTITEFVIYNATAGTDIETIQMTDLRNEFAFFTLTTDSQIELYNRGTKFEYGPYSIPNTTPIFDDEKDHLGTYGDFSGNASSSRGYVQGGGISVSNGYFYFPQKTSNGIDTSSPSLTAPHRLGWITPTPQRYIRIDKL